MSGRMAAITGGVFKVVAYCFIAVPIIGMGLWLLWTAVVCIGGFAKIIYEVCDWLMRIDHDLLHHHYGLSLNWSTWTPAAYRLAAWMGLIALCTSKFWRPLLSYLRLSRIINAAREHGLFSGQRN